MASFLGIGIGILLGRGRSLDTIAIFPVLLAIVVWLITDLELNVQIDSTDELFFGLAESGAADVNFLVLPVVFALVTALMAALAIPLGPLLRSMPRSRPTAGTSPARCSGSPRSRPCPRPARRRSCGSWLRSCWSRSSWQEPTAAASCSGWRAPRVWPWCCS